MYPTEIDTKCVLTSPTVAEFGCVQRFGSELATKDSDLLLRPEGGW